MGRAREQTKGATFLKYLSMGRARKLEKYNRFLKKFISPHRVEHGKSVFKTIFKNLLSLNVK